MIPRKAFTLLTASLALLAMPVLAGVKADYSVSSPLEPKVMNGEKSYTFDIRNNHTSPIVVKLRIRELTQRKINSPREPVAIKMNKRLLLILPREMKTVTVSLDKSWEGEDSHKYLITSSLVGAKDKDGNKVRNAPTKSLVSFMVRPSFKDEEFLFADIVGDLLEPPTQLTSAERRPIFRNRTIASEPPEDSDLIFPPDQRP
ncbi:hypothetical protein [Kordiimonas laminariae]|uniref:hypothetical protein n=1 Tax=Kordiimonas laminariae TaxID=2917717 RepID=UPI001FF2D713|nr:hypothetical protein [Kordiimonas laminariae]MCK0068135.1 hypothetical protein [Kordiimonas laminariae]